MKRVNKKLYITYHVLILLYLLTILTKITMDINRLYQLKSFKNSKDIMVQEMKEDIDSMVTMKMNMK